MKNQILFILILAILTVACEKNEIENKPQAQAKTSNHSSVLSGEILEVLQTPSYTYLRVKDNVQEKWIAVVKMEAEAGKKVYYSRGMEMKNFESKTLNKVFPSVWFVDRASLNSPPTSMPVTHSGNTSLSAAKAEVSIGKSEGEVSVKDLYESPEKYNGKVVTVKGKVTKFNANILDRNWVHIQDGTEFNGKFDLTITTGASVKSGEIVSFTGEIELNKDFGAGYKYDIIMQKAKVKK